MRFDTPKKKPLSNFAAEAAPLKGAVLGRIIQIHRFEAKIETTIARLWSTT